MTVIICRLGEPVTLCWRLERSQADSHFQDSNTIQYDVHAAVRYAISACHQYTSSTKFWYEVIRCASITWCLHVQTAHHRLGSVLLHTVRPRTVLFVLEQQ